jgi:uncharacterized membrane protein
MLAYTRTMAIPLALAFAIGVVAGLRSMTAPAAVCWAAKIGWIDLRQSPLAFMGSSIAAYVFGIAAIAELIGDKLPFTPSRLTPGPLAARIIIGALCGATLVSADAPSPILGAVAGAIGGLAGAFAGYRVRVGTVSALELPDVLVALTEDAVAILGAIFIASRV